MQKRNLILILLLSSVFSCLAQTKKNEIKSGKKSSYTVLKEPNTNMKKGKCMFNIKFVGVDGTPHKSGARLIFNNDTIFPKIDAKGVYHDWINEGKYKITAFVPYWQDVITDSILFKKNQIITIRLKFEAIELRPH